MNGVRRRALTLVELLVVIAIMVIVAGISYPVFVRAKEAAKGPRTKQNLRTLQVAAVLYAADYHAASAGTPEEMGLPPLGGTIHPYPNTNRYLQPWYPEMKSPFGTAIEWRYGTFAIPSDLDRLPVPWANCTNRIGDGCTLYWDRYSAGRDPVTGDWAVNSHYARKRLYGITLAGNLLTRNAPGDPYSQEWWSPGSFTTRN